MQDAEFNVRRGDTQQLSAMDKPSNYYRHTRREMIQFIPKDSKRFLDVGCGDGRFGALLKETLGQIEVWGVEPTEPAFNSAKDILDRAVHGLFDDALPLPRTYFDTVIFNDSLEHFVDHLAGLRTAHGLLRESGWLVASIPNVRFWPHVQSYIGEGDWKYQDAGILDRTHLRFFTKRSIPRELEAAGFEVVRLVGINPCWVGLKFKLLNLAFGHRLDDMRFEQFAVVARKR